MAQVMNLLIFLALLMIFRISATDLDVLKIENDGDEEEFAVDSPFPRIIESNHGSSSVEFVKSDRQVQLALSAENDEGFGRQSEALTPVLNTFHNILAVASWDGTIHGIDIKSGAISWSFSSGASLTSHHKYSYFKNNPDANIDGFDETIEQTQGNLKEDQFLFCGKDWNLNIYDKQFGTKSLPNSPEDFIRNTPHVSPDGSLVHGYKTMTTFLIDFKTGKVVRRYNPKGAFSEEETHAIFSEEVVEGKVGSINEGVKSSFNLSHLQPVFITRTDYTLISYDASTGKIQWNVSIAEIDAVAFFLPKMPLGTGGSSAHSVIPPAKWRVHVLPPLNSDNQNQILVLPHYHDDRLSYSERYDANGNILSLPPGKGWVIINDLMAQREREANEDYILKRIEESCERENKCLAKIPETRQTRAPVEKGSSLFHAFKKLLIATMITIFCGLIHWLRFHHVRKSKREEEKPVETGHKRRTRKTKHHKMQEKILQSTNHDATNLLILRNEDALENAENSIGKMIVSHDVIDSGSNGTMIFKGFYNGRDVAIKRLVKACHETATKEIQNLIASDQHPNIVRWYGSEMDADFVYVALERCTCSLSDLVFATSTVYQPNGQAISDLQKRKMVQVSDVVNELNIHLWNDNGCASKQLLNLMKDMVTGLSHLHELGIIHRDLKPQNVLISTHKGLKAKLSDMGLSRQLNMNKYSLSANTTAAGSSGWRAPEQLLNGRQTCALDLFSLGCVLFFCITAGKHPFGEEYERDSNIVKGKFDLFPIVDMPEAADLTSLLLNSSPELRPSAKVVLRHHFFWSPEDRLFFLKDASDRIELEDKEKQSDLLQAVENIGSTVFGGTWEGQMDVALLTDVGRYRRYKYDSVRDLLRLIRNKSSHYREFPASVQEMFGFYPEGFENYFRKKFPNLVHEVFKVLSQHCSEEDFFQKYSFRHRG